ncbi:SGNH/GDSL hydrolase family protein [Bizionia paragorgiae]|uniref:GDSL-like Lipase/Acylhydrolase family n=1 Tax=Bizionia paragorgiae TaxID=283786 RepID=A0A1H4CLM5_BIZPA|nr:GDSL-type esterase/lipase family protein [Bizionia paragorgiae]SEA60962.1 GDSL-like Lipase/Acylhydrolase family [Bizionia paragorgiae]
MKKTFLPLLIITLFFNTGCSQNSDNLINDEDYYNIRKVKTIFDLGHYNIKIKGNDIYFDNIHDDISSPTQYNNLYTEFNFNNIYQIKDRLENTYYFRFGWDLFYENENIFTNVEWIGDMKPKQTENFIDFNFQIVDIDYIQFGKKTLCTIGDSQTWWNKAQSLRKYINESFNELIFIGSNTDIYGYGHEGEGGNSVSQLSKRIDNIPYSDYYTLLIGTNNEGSDIETTANDIVKITNHLVKLNPDAKILYLTPIPTTNESRDLFNRNLCENILLKFKNNENIIILDLGTKMRENKNWKSDYLENDGLHQSDKGVRFMSKLIGEKIKTIANNSNHCTTL